MSSGAEEIRAGQTVKQAQTPRRPGLQVFSGDQREPKRGRQEREVGSSTDRWPDLHSYRYSNLQQAPHNDSCPES